MESETCICASRLTNDDLSSRLKQLAAAERRVTAQFVAHLAEIETRRLHLKAGYGSLFTYCREVLALSEHESYNRIEVARAARSFPVILDMLAAGSMNLTTIRLLAPHLTPDNHHALLASAQGKRKLEVEEIVAGLAPEAEAPAWIRRLPVPLAPPRGFALPPAASTTALAPERYRLQVTIDGGTLGKIQLAKDMLGHAVPGGGEATVLDRALTALLEDLARAKFAATAHPRPSGAATATSRHIPAEVKRAVWVRDVGRCAFVGTGRRCDARRFLEFHHVTPYAAGGAATVANIQLRCQRHNDYEARVFFARDEREDESGAHS